MWRHNIILFLQLLIATNQSIFQVNGFVAVNPSVHRNHKNIANKLFSQGKGSDADDDSWDSPEDYDQFKKKEDDKDKDDFPLSSPNLGINIGAQLKPLSEEEAAQLRAEAKAEIDKAFDDRLEEIESLKKMVSDDFERSKKAMQYASDLRAKEQTEILMNKIDKISNEFLSKNKELREGTKLAAAADKNMEGKGIDVGSWGTLAGTEVLTASSSGSKALLGSVGSADSAGNVVEAEGFEENVVASDNRILVICDDQQDKMAKMVLDKFGDILSDSFDGNVDIKKYSPTANIPMGGDGAQCVILVASSLNGQSSAQNILSRILKRAAPIGGGKITVPPSHLMVLSTHGTERTDKFPYSMQNLMGNKLTKRREVEEAVITTVKSRLEKGLNVPPMDYTILKLGDVIDDNKASSKGDLTLLPGDALDGEVGINAAANTLLQAVAYQPYARNATMSIAGGKFDDEDAFWNGIFLKLDGPELWRSESLVSGDEVDRKFGTLTEYMIQWSNRFENDASKEGLTTPVSIVASRKPPSIAEGVLMRSGVRFQFKPTNTGVAYQSKSEERAFERQDAPKTSTGDGKKKTVNPLPMKKQKKEGGVEIFVEKTTSNELRVRARRCNMDDQTVIKEISEDAILKKLQKAIEVWVREQ